MRNKYTDRFAPMNGTQPSKSGRLLTDSWNWIRPAGLWARGVGEMAHVLPSRPRATSRAPRRSEADEDAAADAGAGADADEDADADAGTS